MTDERIQSFEQFWPYYVSEHRDPRSRLLHYIGTALGTATLVVAASSRNPWLVPLALVFGYGPAWAGHFFVERNRPATFQYPLWSLASDYKMLGLALRGKMQAEVARLCDSPQ